jgi:hypothetical protein
LINADDFCPKTVNVAQNCYDFQEILPLHPTEKLVGITPRVTREQIASAGPYNPFLHHHCSCPLLSHPNQVSIANAGREGSQRFYKLMMGLPHGKLHI